MSRSRLLLVVAITICFALAADAFHDGSASSVASHSVLHERDEVRRWQHAAGGRVSEQRCGNESDLGLPPLTQLR